MILTYLQVICSYLLIVLISAHPVNKPQRRSIESQTRISQPHENTRNSTQNRVQWSRRQTPSRMSGCGVYVKSRIVESKSSSHHQHTITAIINECGIFNANLLGAESGSRNSNHGESSLTPALGWVCCGRSGGVRYSHHERIRAELDDRTRKPTDENDDAARMNRIITKLEKQKCVAASL